MFASLLYSDIDGHRAIFKGVDCGFYTSIISPGLKQIFGGQCGSYSRSPAITTHKQMPDAIGMLSRLPGTAICKLCDATFETKGDIEAEFCSTCDYWVRMEQTVKRPNVIIAGGQLYRLEYEGFRGKKEWGKGFGGQKFYIRMPNGRETCTNSLWHLSIVPDQFKEYFQDNAVLRSTPFPAPLPCVQVI